MAVCSLLLLFISGGCHPKHSNTANACIKYTFYLLWWKYPSRATVFLAAEQYIKKWMPFSHCVFSPHIFKFLPWQGFFPFSFWSPNLHFSGSSVGKTNREPSKSLPRAVFRCGLLLDRWNAGQNRSFPISIEGEWHGALAFWWFVKWALCPQVWSRVIRDFQ